MQIQNNSSICKYFVGYVLKFISLPSVLPRLKRNSSSGAPNFKFLSILNYLTKWISFYHSKIKCFKQSDICCRIRFFELNIFQFGTICSLRRPKALFPIHWKMRNSQLAIFLFLCDKLAIKKWAVSFFFLRRFYILLN